MKKTICLLTISVSIALTFSECAQNDYTTGSSSKKRVEKVPAKQETTPTITPETQQAATPRRTPRRYSDYARSGFRKDNDLITLDPEKDTVYVELDTTGIKKSLPVYGSGIKKLTIEALRARYDSGLYDLKAYCPAPPQDPLIYVVRSKSKKFVTKNAKADSGEIAMMYLDIEGNEISRETAISVCRPIPDTPPPPPPPHIPPPPITVPLFGTLFYFDKYTLTDSAKSKIRATMSGLNDFFSSYRLVINGHTDSKGTRAYNDKLSRNRAKAVKNWIMAHYDIPASRITSHGYGEDRLLYPNNGHHAKNRRVEIVIEDYVPRDPSRTIEIQNYYKRDRD